MPEKDESPPSTMTALAQGLSIAQNPKVSQFERFGPAIALVLYVSTMFLLAFDVVPNPDVLTGFLALLGPVIGAWAGKLGASG